MDRLKLSVHVEESNWHSVSEERIWVSPLRDGSYSLENIPMYARGLAYKDVVKINARESGDPGIARVVTRSGHSTYRLLLMPGKFKPDFDRMWPALERLGCAYESNAGHEDVFAVDVPLTADLHAAYALFEEGLELGIWDFEEAYRFER